jgi:dual specificity phosphatase 12
MHVKVNDVPSENIRKHFNSTFNFIKRGRTLIHCAAGISRSPTILAAYLMRKDKVTHRQALRRIAKKRPCISPNPGFIEQLKQFEDDLKQKSNASDTEATAT